MDTASAPGMSGSAATEKHVDSPRGEISLQISGACHRLSNHELVLRGRKSHVDFRVEDLC